MLLDIKGIIPQIQAPQGAQQGHANQAQQGHANQLQSSTANAEQP